MWRTAVRRINIGEARNYVREEGGSLKYIGYWSLVSLDIFNILSPSPFFPTEVIPVPQYSGCSLQFAFSIVLCVVCSKNSVVCSVQCRKLCLQHVVSSVCRG